MDQDQLKSLVEATTSEYFWWAICFGAALYFKNAIENLVWGLTFMLSRDYCVDEEMLLGGSRKARILRQTISKTTFYLYDNNSILTIPNRDLPSLRCEKVLIHNLFKETPKPSEKEKSK